jgi:hypothetical protein
MRSPVISRLAVILPLLTLACALNWSGCKHCPVVEPPATQYVHVSDPCLDPLPPLTVPAFPAQNADGSYTLPLETARQLTITLYTLNQYLTTQIARCGVHPAMLDAGATDAHNL